MDWIQAYEQMLRIRLFEEAVEKLFLEGEISGTAHTAIGQEAIAVGVCAELRAQDRITSTHRGHGHLLARGGDPKRMLAELFGRAPGYSGGKGGSQMMADRSIGFLGGNGITGGSLPIAVGAALAARMSQRDSLAVCFFGDGASNQGTFHESMNLAAIWKLPVLFVCENNRYAMSTPTAYAVAEGGQVAPRAAGYGIPALAVDGNWLPEVREAAREARERALAGNGPTLLECRTYRLSGHSRGDPRVYRSRDEEKRARQHEPLVRTAAFLRRESLLDEDGMARIRKEVAHQIEEAVEFARRAPAPEFRERNTTRCAP